MPCCREWFCLPFSNPVATSRTPLLTRSSAQGWHITLGYPRWKLSYPVVANLRQLAPTREMLHIGDASIFEEMYRSRLDELGVGGVRKLLTDCAERANNEHLLALCYEDLTKPGLS